MALAYCLISTPRPLQSFLCVDRLRSVMSGPSGLHRHASRLCCSTIHILYNHTNSTAGTGF